MKTVPHKTSHWKQAQMLQIFSSTTTLISRVSSLGYFHFSEHGTDRDEMDSMRSSKGSCILSDSDEHMTFDKE